MKMAFNRVFKIGFFIVVLIDVIIGFTFFKSRLYSHLGLWKIVESSAIEDFYWELEHAPEYFYFENQNPDLDIFKEEILPLVNNKNDEFEIVLKVARYTADICTRNVKPGMSLKWGSPEKILKQVKNGASLNCFSRSILFSTYLSSIGIRSRLWALENERFNGIAHTINEVYVESLKKWVFIDISMGFYAIDKDLLSFLEMREKALSRDADTMSLRSIYDKTTEKNLPVVYPRLVKAVFLRASNNFVCKYDEKIRYGVFSIFHKYIDMFPDEIRRGLNYSLGGREVFVHYIDKFSGSLKMEIITAKSFFYFFAFSSFLILVYFAGLGLIFLNRLLLKSLSRECRIRKA